MNERDKELYNKAMDSVAEFLLLDPKKFADLIRADEREACAKFCETYQVWVGQGKRGFTKWGEEDFATGGRHQGMDYAGAIRARENT